MIFTRQSRAYDQGIAEPKTKNKFVAYIKSVFLTRIRQGALVSSQRLGTVRRRAFDHARESGGGDGVPVRT
jgi:hypothetical protein